MLTVHSNLIWSPVRNLDIGLELIYSRGEADPLAINAFTNLNTVNIGAGGAAAANRPVIVAGQDRYEEDNFGAVFRIQRNF